MHMPWPISLPALSSMPVEKSRPDRTTEDLEVRRMVMAIPSAMLSRAFLTISSLAGLLKSDIVPDFPVRDFQCLDQPGYGLYLSTNQNARVSGSEPSMCPDLAAALIFNSLFVRIGRA